MSDPRIDEPPISDDDLARQFAAVDSEQSDQALELLWLRHQPNLSSAALRFCFGRDADADDAMQELFLRLQKSRATFRPDRGTWVGWAAVVLRRLVLESKRSSQPKNFQFVRLEEGLSFGVKVPSPLEETEHWAEFRKQFIDCFSRLTNLEKRLVVWRWLRGFVVREISEKTGMTQDKATLAVRHVHAQLKSCLEGKRRATDSDSDSCRGRG